MTTDTETKNLIGKKTALVGIILFVMMFTQTFIASAKSVSLAWDPSPGEVAGYNIRYGTTPGEYTQVLSVGNVTNASVSGLTAGVTYYFVVTAFNDLHLESEPSNEVSHMFPVQADLKMRSVEHNGTQFLSIDAEITGEWTLESSVDLQVWTPYTNGTGAISIQLPIAGEPNRFFRVKQ